MNIILGATGQVGSMLADRLLVKGQPVRAVVRDGSRAQELKSRGAEIVVADYFDMEAMNRAFQGGSSAFLLTPENPASGDVLGDARRMIDNYREAVRSSGVTKIVGLSSMGAQLGPGSGNLMASHMLEHAFAGLEVEQVFIRPAYYYSNWLGYLELAREHGMLPTFFPPGLKLPMVAPPDVAEFLAEVLIRKAPQQRVFEITGPRPYSSADIAQVFGHVLGREVNATQILPQDWESTLLQAGFSKDAAKNLMLMTQMVVDGKTGCETPNPVRLPTDFESYLKKSIG
ncbi:NAD(P)H-binding protein [Methanocella sp. MCL-LM]|uniref:NmrA family NAD(P)-binding protein n=1 Tax=Methanocella sp. MCL-LM TaxID=3412035 RepID=UPI003C70D5EB